MYTIVLQYSLCLVVFVSILLVLVSGNQDSARRTGLYKHCNLGKIGEQFQEDKFDSCHRYQQFYCDLLLPYKHHQFTLLEIGMGCGHHTSCPKSPMMWKTFLPYVDYYGIDYLHGKDRTPEDCLQRLKKEYPEVRSEGRMWFGSQGDKKFLRRFINETGNVRFDVIIDDGSHSPDDQLNSFTVLWPQLADGGLYIVEDLQVGREGFPTWVGHWTYLLGAGLVTGRADTLPNTENMAEAKDQFPKGLKFAGCSFQLCFLRKALSSEDALPDDGCVI